MVREVGGYDLLRFIIITTVTTYYRVDLVGMITKKTVKEYEISRPLLITTFDVDFDVNRKHTNYVRNRLEVYSATCNIP